MDSRTFRQSFRPATSGNDAALLQDVMSIIGKVRQEKDQALFAYTEEFDQQKLGTLRVTHQQLKDSFEQLDDQVKDALMSARDRIIAYETQIKNQDQTFDEFQYVYRALEKVGIYVPGGTALYPSSVLMTVVPAQVAGVKEIHVTTPTFMANNITFATLYLLGVKNVYTVGGAQAIAALAYGTETIPKVDKIVGPGNAYVAMAKRLVFGDVGIDAIAGPSEILLYVDNSVNIDAIVYDLFAQAEHDANARTFLLSEDAATIEAIEQRMKQLIKEQPRQAIIRQSLDQNHYQIVDSRENLLSVINEIACEHVSIQHQDEAAIVTGINYAGAVFKGKYSPEAIGDYIAGPSHVLPTAGTARFSHGLNVNDFMTSHAVIGLRKESFNNIVDAAATIAETEQLFAHRDSLMIRKEVD